MTARHPPLTAEEVIAGGGWHPRYARVIALASDDGYGFALVDGNGDEASWRQRPGPGGTAPGDAGPPPAPAHSTASGRSGPAARSTRPPGSPTAAPPAGIPSRSRSTAATTWYRSGNTAYGRSSPPVQAEAAGTTPSSRTDRTTIHARQRKTKTRLHIHANQTDISPVRTLRTTRTVTTPPFGVDYPQPACTPHAGRTPSELRN